MADDLMEKVYFDESNPAGFASVEKLRRAVGAKRRDKVVKWLEGQPVYSIHRQVRKHYPTNFYRAIRPNQTWEIDLLSMENLADVNPPIRFLLIVIDIFDRFAWAEPLKSKSAVETTQAMRHILDTSGRKPSTIQSDGGKEFVNKEFQKLLRDRGIRFRIAGGFQKAAVVERFNRTLRDKLWRVFYHRGSYEYRDILQKMIGAYNASIHRMTGLAPRDVTEQDRFGIWFTQYIKHMENFKRAKYSVGQYVRLRERKKGDVFARGYSQGFSEEVFRIHQVQTTHRSGLLARPIYHLKDLSGEVIKTGFYEEEFVPIQFDERSAEYKIEKIIRSRRNKKTGRKEYFVKFLGYPNSMNAYVDAAAVSGRT